MARIHAGLRNLLGPEPCPSPVSFLGVGHRCRGQPFTELIQVAQEALLLQSDSRRPYASGVCVCVLVAQSCPTLCDPVDCSPPGSYACVSEMTGLFVPIGLVALNSGHEHDQDV